MANSLTGISIASSYDSLLKVGDNDGLTASLKAISDGLGTSSGISLNNAGDLTATGTITGNSFVGDLSGNISGNSTVSGTLTFGSLSDGVITITDIKDEDNLASDSATALATQQSIKAYVDAQVTASDLDYTADTGGVQSVDLDSQTFTISGTTNEITTSASGQTLTVGLASAISGLTSVAATTFTGALTGNSSTTTALATSRNIAGVAFDGTGDISLTTANITEGANLYYTQARFDSALSAKSTTDLSEGTNLYYTDARADARIALNTGSNLDLSSKSTSDLSEGTNLYFTDERVDDRVGSLIVGGTGITATYDDAANSLTITNSSPDQTVAVVGSNGVTNGGSYPNLTVAGVDATTSAKGVASFSSSHFSVSSGAVSIAADSIDDTLIDFGTGTNQVNTDDLPEGSTNQYYTSARANTDFDTRLGTKDTDNLSEGSSNLYYTDTRANSAFDTRLGTKTTDNLTEGSTNKYWTAERTDDQVNSLLTAGSGITLTYDDAANTLTVASNVSGLALTDLSATDAGGDGSFAYNNSTGVFTYTGPSAAEVKAHIDKTYVDSLGIAATTAAGLTGTPNISVGTIGASGTITGDLTGDVTGNLTGNVTGNTSGSSGSTTGNAATATALQTARTINGASFDGTANIAVDTDAVSEGSSNLYYTDARWDTRLGTKTTDNLTEGSSNKYNVTHTGDVTGATALTIASDAVTYDKMQDLVTANRVLGGTAAGTIVETQIATDMVSDDAITYAKIQDTTTANRVLGAVSAGVISEVQVATDMLSDDCVTLAKVDSDLRAVEYIGLDATDYIQFADNSHVDMFINNVHKFRFEADGDFHADGDVIAYSTTTPSDEKLKENVKVVENPLEKLEQLRGVTFDWKNREDKQSGGIIAQELQKVMPDLVREVDSINSEDDSYLAVDYNGVIALLIEAVKELTICTKCNCKK